VTFQKGKANPRAEAMAAAKAKVIALVSEGWARYTDQPEIDLLLAERPAN
jgi:hypothetical protein